MKSLPRASFGPAAVWALLLVGLAGNVAGWLLIGALPDEAYYWVWSQRLQAGYFDHPPLVAWMIRPFTELFGDSAWIFRLPSVLAWFAGVAFAWAAGRRLFGSSRAGVMAAVIWTSLPIVQIGFHVNTPDTPMVLFAWAAFYCVLRALDERALAWWVATGICAGLAVVGKYPGVLVPVALLLGLVLTRAGRMTLAGPGPWLGALVALLVFSPVVWWNWQHDWISFAFQLHHGVKRETTDPLGMFLAFLGGQWGAVLPWTWLAMAAAALPWRRQLERMDRSRFAVLAAGFWLPLLVFGAAGLTSTSHPNWPVTAYVPGTLLLAGALDAWLARGRGRAAIVAGCYLFGVLAVNLLRFPQWLQALPIQLPAQRTQLSQTYGWDEVSPVLHELVAGRDDCVVVGNRLQTTAMLALILDDVDRVAVAEVSRFNQFHLWQREQPPGELCLYVEQFNEDEAIPERLDLGVQGPWRLARVIEHNNPDRTLRRTAFFRPQRGDR